MNPILKSISPQQAKLVLDAGHAILIDVRESDEHARAHIVGARLAPLSVIDTHDFDRDHNKIAIFHCRSGMRTQAAGAQLLSKGFREAYFLDGGLDAWAAQGLPVHVNTSAPLEMQRQVQIAAGALILIGAALGVALHPGFFALSAFVGAGLLQAGITGWCGMALLLKGMPWNRPRLADIKAL